MISLTFLAPAPYLNANDSGHWAPRAERVRIWRAHVAHQASRYDPAITSWPVDVFVRLDVPDKRRRDPANYAPTLKVLIDSLGPARTYTAKGKLVHNPGAGWWPDDTPEYVHTHEPELRPVGRRTGLTVTITVKERP